MSLQPFRCPSTDACALLTHAHTDYDRLFNLSPDLICIAGLDGRFRRVNPSWTRVLGWTEAELLSQPVEYFMHPDDRERTLKARAELARGNPVRGLENRYRCKDGSYRWLSWQSVTEPCGTTVFAVARDITDRRQLEQERLVLSKLESTGVLAGGIAHDFNNLLASILLNVEMVSFSETIGRNEKDLLRQASQAIRTATSLTQQLIAFADGGVAARRIADVAPLLSEAVDAALSGSTVPVECAIAADLRPAEVDEAQLGQALRNVIQNAREAIRPGGSVRIRAENLVPPPGTGERVSESWLRIIIEDEGVGIPGHLLPRIFDPYFSTKQRGSQKGMGLGLTIARTIIREHGGTLAIESREGAGTIVTIQLPAQPAKNSPVPSTPSAPPPPSTARRILVMDDEEMLRDILTLMLQRLGYEVEVTKDGDEAVERYERAARAGRPFALVLLDLTVRGGMGGSETIRALRAIDPAVRAVLMTGYTNEDAFRFPGRLGFRGSLAKPFSVAALQQVLAEAMTEPSRQAEAGA